jgi:hypothetical protein
MTGMSEKGRIVRWLVACVAVLPVCAGGAGLALAQSGQSSTAATTRTTTSAATTSSAATSRPAETARQSAADRSATDLTSGAGLDAATEHGSRGVARHLLLAGIAAAVVIAVLSGMFAFRHKKR